ncbi:MAG: class I SAM-dependent methyltransferase [Chitinophagaceae bacterium]|nr:class I SAM-dependent methyltransferase [Chitinophagaceae bacterium]
MNTQQAYNAWASQYDTNLNKTRDLEAIALRSNLATINFNRCFEIGCGTGKNTVWFAEKAKHVTAVDLSEEMLAKAKEKVSSDKVEFKQADITKDWTFRNGLYDLVSFSLVLEHIDNLDHIFKEVSASLNTGGYVYIGELHPFKQYNGSKARFETGTGIQVIQCFNHHLSDFLLPAKKYGLSVVDINEYFDDDNRNEIPRILTILFRK